MKEAVGLINGQVPGSIYEWRVAVALWKYKWNFAYQVQYFGGRRLPGGQVIDFLVFTLPKPTPVYVQGEHWHGGIREENDIIKINLLWSRMKNSIRKPEIFQGKDLHNQKDTNNLVLWTFGRNQ